MLSGGKIQVESKDDIRKRIGRSTDDGDAVVQAYWEEHSSAEDWIAWAKRKAEQAEAAAAGQDPEPRANGRMPALEAAPEPIPDDAPLSPAEARRRARDAMWASGGGGWAN